MSVAQKRIVMDIKRFMEQSYEDKFIYFDKSNFTELYLMIVGPKATPYEDGILLFQLNFPNDYPYSPPKVDFLNKKEGVRIHPNLYTSGKVCLSILGTWPGPSWEPTMSLDTVAITIQSILNENPLNNEPGYYEKKPDNKFCKDYIVFTTYHKYTILLNDVIDGKFKACNFFKKEINDFYSKNKENLNNLLLTYREIYDIYTINNKPYYKMQNIVNFNKLTLKKI
jgi:ubiquitin-protein ligase